MTDTQIQRSTQIDSLRQNEFEVLLDGQRLQGVQRVAGLKPFRLDIKPAQTKLIRDPITLTKLVQRDPTLPFNAWLRETIAAGEDIARPTRTLTLVAIDDGVEIRRWQFNEAYIADITYSDFDSGLVELVQETIVVHFASITETWSGA